MNYTYREFRRLRATTGKDLNIRIVTGSMKPWIQPGSYVKVKTARFEELKLWDIVIYWRKEALICHVVAKIDSAYIITSPLNKPFKKKLYDPPVHKSAILGVVTEPKFGLFHRLMLRFFI